MPQAQVGSKKSVPKVVRVNADDSKAAIYRNLGNGRRVPLLWGTTVTLASGTQSKEVLSGVKFSNHEVCNAVVSATLLENNNVGRYYIEKNTVSNKLTLKTENAVANADTDFDIMVFLGDATTFSSTDTNQIWA